MGSKTGRLHNRAGKSENILTVRICDSFACRLRGLMFQKSLPPKWGLLLVQSRSSRLDAAIHMLWMRFPIAVVWIDEDWRVVDARLARPWVSFLVPAQPARYILETAPEYLDLVAIGDEVNLEILPGA